MMTENPIEALSQQIRRQLQEGLFLSASLCDVIESLCGLSAKEAIYAVIENPNDALHASIIEMIFFPDIDFQGRLEDTLGQYAFSPQDELSLCRALSDPPAVARLVFDHNSESVHVSLPESAIDSFVQRLRISCPLPESLTSAANRLLSQPFQGRARVKLRNARCCFSEATIKVLMTIFHHIDGENTMNDLDFLLDFLSTHCAETLAEDLTAYRERLWDLYDHGMHHEQRYKKHNMETIMLLGRQMPYVNRDKLRNTIRSIDRIAMQYLAGTH